MDIFAIDLTIIWVQKFSRISHKPITIFESVGHTISTAETGTEFRHVSQWWGFWEERTAPKIPRTN